MLLKQIQAIFREELGESYTQGEIDHFFYLFLEHYLGLERFSLVKNPAIILDEDKTDLFMQGLAKLKQHYPVQYILGSSWFMGLTFKVDESVLIPRPETEGLVRMICETFDPSLPLKILDIGTGSGCIAIALGDYFKNASVTAIDISKQALAIASLNASTNGIEVGFKEIDILEVEALWDNFDLIVSNPPYVRQSEKSRMQPNVLLYEPDSALYVADKDPLVFYRKICSLASEGLKEGGELFLEINQYLGEESRKLLQAGKFSEIELLRDLYGNYRYLRATKR